MRQFRLFTDATELLTAKLSAAAEEEAKRNYFPSPILPSILSIILSTFFNINKKKIHPRVMD